MRIFRNANEKLIAIIKERLDAVNATKEEREIAEREFALIKKNEEAQVFLFYYDLVQFLQKENIYFCARGSCYTSLYCSYLLGFLEYNPISLGLSTEVYEAGVKAYDIEIQKSRYDEVVKYLFDAYGANLFQTTTNLDPLSIYFGRFLLAYSDLTDLEKVEIEGQTLVKLSKNTVKGKDFFVFHLVGSNSLDKIQQAESSSCGVNYEDFQDINAYEYLGKVKLTPMFFDIEEIAAKTPANILELAYCTHKNTVVTPRNLPHWVNYAIIYYKLAKLRLLGFVDNSIEVKEEFIVELPDEEDKTCALEAFLKSLDFVKENEEFKLVDLQRYLQCRFGTACKVRDALIVLCVIEMAEGPSRKYRRIKK